MLRLADTLGRGRGGTRLLDHLNPPSPPALRPDLRSWQQSSLAAAWIGHATVLLRVGGRTVLTDPVFSSRVGLGLGLVTGGPQRLVSPALSIRELPSVDLIVISHAHFDHLDRPTLNRLPKKTPVVVARGTRDLVEDLGFRRVQELGWGESARIDGLEVTGWEVRHWGARTFHDEHRGCSAFVVEAAGRRVLFGGDTAYGTQFRGVGRVDLAVLGIGAYDPWVQAHATPEQAWAMAEHVRAEFVLPMHYRTFRLSYEPQNEPLERLLAAAGRDAERIVCREIGATWSKG